MYRTDDDDDATWDLRRWAFEAEKSIKQDSGFLENV
jgi:hypothetical protein